jgi:hypothetical protein
MRLFAFFKANQSHIILVSAMAQIMHTKNHYHFGGVKE